MTRTVSVGLKANLASAESTVATCLKVVRVDTTVLGFTAFNRDIGPISGVTYYSAKSYTLKDITTSGALNVDSTEIDGPVQYPNVTETDLLAGLWDYAYFEIFTVNYADLTQGIMILRAGHLGEISVARGEFTAQLRGLTEAYTRTIGRIDSPMCPWALGDANCTADVGPFTVTGTVTSVNADNVTFGDTSRTEPGPAAAQSIVDISNANPGVVTLPDNFLSLVEGQAITLFGIVGPVSLNANTIVRNLRAGTGTQFLFDLGVDTSNTTDYPPYTGGGMLTPLGGSSGYFDYGLVTWLTGNNAGYQMEVASYVPAQFKLGLPMPNAIQVGDTYQAVAGCDRTFPTCRDRFNNVLNFGGEPYFPGSDKIIQVGRHGS